jgi:tRNA-dihydrouridine synthase
MRKGIDSDHLTYLEAAKAAEGAGVAAIALHARTAADFYSGQADWSAIARLKEAVSSVPVLGNGDIWSGEDALRMVDETGCDGVVVGRGCLGRPWLFGDLAAAFRARAGEISEDEAARLRAAPSLGDAVKTLRRHAELLVEFFGDEGRACRDIRKHVAWYLKGYPAGHEVRASLSTVGSLDEMDEILATLDWSEPYPGRDAEGPRGRAGSPKKPALPENWLASRDLERAGRADLAAAEREHSGG